MVGQSDVPSALRKPLEVFESKQDEFADQHHGQFVVIHGDEVAGFFEDEVEAYTIGKSKFGTGQFLLRCCVRRDEEVTATFHSRVA